MKAAVCRAFGEPLVVEEIEIGPVGPGELGVEIAACAICQSDIHFLQGAWGGPLPAVYGHEAAGIVTEIGEGVEGFTVGDHVVVTLIRSCGTCVSCARDEPVLCEGTFGLDERSLLHAHDGTAIVQGLGTGAFAEQVVVDASQAVVVPDSIPLDVASLLACGVITGFGAVVNTAAVEPGSTVVVIGCGGVGLNAVQGAALAGAPTVVAVDPVEAKRDAAQAFGATNTIDPGTEDVVGAVKAVTGGRGADYVIVTVGARDVVERGIPLLRRGGTMVIVGMPASGVTATIDPGMIANDNHRIIGSKMGSARIAKDIPHLVKLYEDGRLKLDELISGRYPLSGINDAIAEVASGQAIRNVIVFGRKEG